MSERYDDDITRYIVTRADGWSDYCPSCARERPVWIGITVGGDELRCCASCQRVLSRAKAKPDERRA